MATKTINLRSTGTCSCHMQIKDGEPGVMLTFFHKKEKEGFYKVNVFMPECGLKSILKFMAESYLKALEEEFKARIHGLRSALCYSKSKAIITYGDKN